MELDFDVTAPRLRALGLHVTTQEQDLLSKAVPWLMQEHGLNHVTYFGKVFTVEQSPYLVLLGYGPEGTAFLVSRDGTNWTMLPEADEKARAALEELGYGPQCQVPFSGKVSELLPRPEGEPEEEEEPEEAEEEPEEEFDEDGNPLPRRERTPKPPKPEKPLKPTEAHRLSQNLSEIHKHLQIIIMAAYSKKNGAAVRNSSFRGLAAPEAKDLATAADFQRFLAADYSGDITACTSLADYPNSFVYPSAFNSTANALVARSRLWPGCLYYVFAGTLIWGSVYEGTGLANLEMPGERM